MAICAALYADDVALVSPRPTSMQVQLDALASFAATEGLRVSKEKTVIMLLNCAAQMNI